MHKKFYLSGLSAIVLVILSGVGTTFIACRTVDLEVSFGLGDITQLNYKKKKGNVAVVNAANPQLQGGDGVCGAIFNAAGRDVLQKACEAITVLYDDVRCAVGNACITDSFDLVQSGIHHIIHAVGPDCRVVKNAEEQDRLLQLTYENALRVAHENKIESIIFPFISCGIYAFPRERACEIALKTVKEYAAKNVITVKSIQFVLFSKEDFHLFCTTWKKIIL